MKKIYFLASCDTCRNILKKLKLEGVELQNIKENPVSEAQLEELYAFTASYEALLNKRAKRYREIGLNNQMLTERKCKALILAEYTFLKRPIALIDDQIFIGNSKATVAALENVLN